MRIVISIYNPPELYPPTLYAVELLAAKAESVTIVTRNIACKHRNFPPNVKVVRVGESMSMEQAMMLSQFQKMKAFIGFERALAAAVRKRNPQVWLAYDSIALYSFYLLSKVRSLPEVFWYHNHDVSEPGSPPRKYSITWWADKYEKAAFKKLDIFSLPAAERLQYFNLDNLKGKQFIVPNYPLLSFYEKNRVPNRPPENEIKLIYQGRISPDHGFEQLIPILGERIDGKRLGLTLIGNMSDEYRDKLENIAWAKNTSPRLKIMDPVAYEDLPAITATHHIGLAIHKPSSIIYSTGGTASNKIYEYAASGLPVLLFDNEHYRKYLEGKQWTFFTDCTESSMLNAIQSIHDRFEEISDAAIRDFRSSLNYDTAFNEVMKEIENKLQQG